MYTVFSDQSGNIWISTIDQGLYQFNGQSFTNYPVHDAENDSPRAIQSILQDRNGHLWLGCTGGLFRLSSTGLEQVTKDALGITLQFQLIK